MTAVKPFYIEQLRSNFPGLERFVRESEAVSKIEILSKDPKFVRQPKGNTYYFSRWKAIWITCAHPFYSVLSLFASSMALLSRTLYMAKAGRVFTVLSKHLVRDWHQLCSQSEFNSPLLIPSYNTHQLSTWDLYKHGDVPYRHVRDDAIKPLTYQYSVMEKGVREAVSAFFESLEKVRSKQWFFTRIWRRGFTELNHGQVALTGQFFEKYKTNPRQAIELLKDKFPTDESEKPINALYGRLKQMEEALKTIPSISLFSDRGTCRGSSLWFIFLYLRTKHLFQDPSKQLSAIAREFTSGAPKQAALLQAFNDSDDLLKLKKTKMADQKVSLYELDHHHKRAEDKIKELDKGIYRVGVYGHSLVYLKISKDEQYVWDPEFGLYPMDGEEMLQMILKHHHMAGNPRSTIYFHKYESTEHYENELV